MSDDVRLVCAEMQDEVDEWVNRQPWKNDPPTAHCLGLAEEAGEVCRAVLKLEQGIRGTRDEWLIEIEKELGDVFVKLCDVANVYGIDLEKAIKQRWAEVSRRNWSTDPIGHGIEKA